MAEVHSADGGAARLAIIDQLHHFIATRCLGCGAGGDELLIQADVLIGGSDAVLVIEQHRDLQEGGVLGRWRRCCCSAFRQDRRLPDVGVADACAEAESWSCCWRRGCFFPRVGRGSELVGARRHGDRIWNGTDEAGDGPGGDRSCDQSRYALSAACWQMPRVMGTSAGSGRGSPAGKLAWAVGVERRLKVYPGDVELRSAGYSARSSPSAAR